MASFLRDGGSQRRRARTSDLASQQVADMRKWQQAKRMHEALDAFEENLFAEQREKERAYADIPNEAEDMRSSNMRKTLLRPDSGALAKSGTASRLDTRRPSSGSSDNMKKVKSEPQMSQHVEPLHCRRPPSPLGFYDYGCISQKPRSMFAQHRAVVGESVRPAHRKTSCGFYFPGAQMKQGPYGFSMVDPILMPPSATDLTSKSSGLRWSGDPSDMRPLLKEEFGLKRDRVNKDPVGSPLVRHNNGHERRARRHFHCLDNRREEAILEQACFEHGVFEGKWRSPLLDTGIEKIQETQSPEEEHSWISKPLLEMNAAQESAANLLFRLERVANQTRGKLAQLFVDQNNGPTGQLEPAEFIRGLEKHAVLYRDEMTPAKLIGIMHTIDKSFDGRVSLPVLTRAIAYARGVRMQKEQAQDNLRRQRQVKLNTSYSESMPIDVIKVDRYESSLLNFNRSFQKFVNQQKQLLEHHNEESKDVGNNV
eukprot:TRINITY_DN113128_c0_g1_i1.p1 TRINITY_DN113128_c0_g1~~TRINITY_DN113128_c0_g1_i1.p1  ORF type:complete len:482 (+),score=112.67 TRINITY_DN113128_c0_g1_i1:143-1588(+)